MKAATILCVESYESLQVARRMILQRAGYDVQIVSSPSQAVTQANEQIFDVVVICNSLNDGEAEQLARDLRAISPATCVLLLNSLTATAADGTDSPEILLASIRAALSAPPVPQAHRKTV